ncbi:hypothetical protein EI94DRAFT_1696933 [Lactarius quietus]|nr:hypothetical protein EI94DRAFT_1696933 [Lactarius quietus]
MPILELINFFLFPVGATIFTCRDSEALEALGKGERQWIRDRVDNDKGWRRASTQSNVAVTTHWNKVKRVIPRVELQQKPKVTVRFDKRTRHDPPTLVDPLAALAADAFSDSPSNLRNARNAGACAMMGQECAPRIQYRKGTIVEGVSSARGMAKLKTPMVDSES